MAQAFFGGVHPNDMKAATNEKAIEQLKAPAQVVIPMSMHIGAPCKPIVAVGDKVTIGQKIGEPGGFVSAPIHASVSGTVKAVEPRPFSMGGTFMSVVIENDFQNTVCEDVKPVADPDSLTPEQLTEIVKNAGIVGQGGATFPTHVKLSSGMGKVDTIIVNVSECEPFIVADDRLCREHAKELVSGLKIVMKILGLEIAHIAMENNKPEAAEALRWEIDPQQIILDILPAKYPQGAEKQLIKAVTNREVPSGGLPAAVGCAVFNAATCKAIHDAVYEGMPLVKRIVTVSGDILMEPKNLLVPIGTTFQALLDAVGQKENPYKVLSGGPMMGAAQFDLSVPVIKGTNAITVLGKKNRFAVEDPQCIRCGKCIDACPMGLMPVMMVAAAQSKDPDEIAAINTMDCIECGCCAYTCPAGIPLVQHFRTAKLVLRQAQAKAKAGK